MNILIAQKDGGSLGAVAAVLQKQLNIKLFSCSMGFLESMDFLKNNAIDMCFIDTDLLRSHTCACVKAICKRFKGIKLVLICGTLDYLGLAFDVKAAGYILKPVHSVDVFNCIERVEKWNSVSVVDKLILHSKGKDVLVNYNDILFIEASNRKCIVHTNIEQHAMYISMKELLSKLPSNTFLQSHRSFIINIDKVKFIKQYSNTSYNVFFSKDKIAQMSRNYIKAFKSLYKMSALK